MHKDVFFLNLFCPFSSAHNRQQDNTQQDNTQRWSCASTWARVHQWHHSGWHRIERRLCRTLTNFSKAPRLPELHSLHTPSMPCRSSACRTRISPWHRRSPALSCLSLKSRSQIMRQFMRHCVMTDRYGGHSLVRIEGKEGILMRKRQRKTQRQAPPVRIPKIPVLSYSGYCLPSAGLRPRAGQRWPAHRAQGRERERSQTTNKSPALFSPFEINALV